MRTQNYRTHGLPETLLYQLEVVAFRRFFAVMYLSPKKDGARINRHQQHRHSLNADHTVVYRNTAKKQKQKQNKTDKQTSHHCKKCRLSTDIAIVHDLHSLNDFLEKGKMFVHNNVFFYGGRSQKYKTNSGYKHNDKTHFTLDLTYATSNVKSKVKCVLSLCL